MNIFEGMKVVFNEPSSEHITKYVNEFWKLVRELRLALGEKGYYLDEYLSKIFKVLDRLNLGTMGEIANNMYWSIMSDCYVLCETESDKEKSDFFDLVKECIDTHPVNFEHKHTRCEFYAANILINNLNVFSDKVKCSYRKMICLKSIIR